MNNLLHFLRSLGGLSGESWDLLQPALTEKTFRKNELLLREGQVCQSLFYIDSGYCRSYYEIDGLVKNTGFFFENGIATNMRSFGSGQRSEFNIAACEPLKTIVIDKEQLFRAARQSGEIEALGRNCIRVFAVRQEAFATLLQRYTAAERLSRLEAQYPEMLQRVPLAQLASFLGVARETLSRIRKRRMPS